MPLTRSARRAALFQSIGDDVLTHLLAGVSFADRSAITTVCKQWRRIVASKPFEQARQEIGETCLVVVGYNLYTRVDDGNHSRWTPEPTSFLILEGDGAAERVLRCPGRSTGGMRCAVLGREVVVVGSPWGSADSDGSPMRAFDVSKGTWRALAAPPLDFVGEETQGTVQQPALAVVSGRLFCAGGTVWQKVTEEERWELPDMEPPRLACGVYEYDAAADTWLERAEMPRPVFDDAHAVVGDKLYVLGGAGDGGLVPFIQVYDPETNTWELIGIPRAHAGAHATAINGRIYYAGGWNSEELDRRWVEYFVPDANEIVEIRPPGYEDAPGHFPSESDAEESAEESQDPSDPTPPIRRHHGPSGIIDDALGPRYALLDDDYVLQVLDDDDLTWTPLVQLPKSEWPFNPTLAETCLASRVPLI